MTDPEDTQGRPSREVLRNLLRDSGRVIKLLWVERPWLVIGLLVVIVVLSTSPFLNSGARALLINELVRTATTYTLSFAIFWFLLLLALALVVSEFFGTIRSYLHRRFYFMVEEKIELMTVEKKGDIDIAVHESPRYNDLFNRVREQGMWRFQQFVDRLFYLFENLLAVGIALAVLASAAWWVFAVVAIGAVPALLVEARYGRDVWSIHGTKAEMRRRYWTVHRHFDATHWLTELKLFQNVRLFTSLIRDLFRSFQDEQKQVERRRLREQLFALIFSQVALITAVVYFTIAVARGDLQIGTYTFFLASLGELRTSLSALFANLGRFYQDGLFVRDVFTLLDVPPALPRPAHGAVLDPAKTPAIVFDQVTFTYPNAKKPALREFSLTIQPGEKIAFVGPNGAGKTTFVKLLCRFYDPDKGKILVDGKNLKDIDLATWYHMLGVLFQDYSNYYFIVRELIALGRSGKESALEKVKEAAKASEADIFIEEWERTYEQMLGKQFAGGVEPSIGQWQKLALSRTFYRDPRILILDEPTSSIDAEAEAKIFEKLEALPKDHTVILISHRFSTVRQANRICVIEDGRLAELGTHEELLTRDGIYARLFKLQAKGYR